MCERCKATFEEPETLRNGGGDWGEDVSICPECGHDSIAECGICVSCGAPVPDESGDCVCDNCLKHHSNPSTALVYGDRRKENVKVNGFLAFVYSAEEINDILLTHYRGEALTLVDSFRRDGMTDLYVREDPGDFADFIKEEKFYAAEAV